MRVVAGRIEAEAEAEQRQGTQPRLARLLGDLERSPGGGDGGFIGALDPELRRLVGPYPAEPHPVVGAQRELLGALEDPVDFRDVSAGGIEQRAQGAQLVDRPLRRLRRRRRLVEGFQRGAHAGDRLGVGAARQRPLGGLSLVQRRLVPQLAPHGVMGQPFRLVLRRSA